MGVLRFRVYFSLSQLVFAGFHLGSSTSRWWSHASPFISFSRGGFYFFDLKFTSFCFRRALFFMEGVAKYRSSLLFVFGSHSFKFSRNKVERLGCYWQSGKVPAGMLSNYRSIFGKTLPRTSRSFPSAVVVLDPPSSLYIFRECSILGLPLVSIMDSSMDFSYSAYPIPGNPMSYGAARLLLLLGLEAVSRGLRKRAFVFHRRRLYGRGRRFGRRSGGYGWGWRRTGRHGR